MYGKLFASLYQGTLRGRSHEILVFTNLIAHCDKTGFVDKHFRAISDEVGLTVDEVKAALLVLESPDPESRTPDLEGARIKRLDDHRAWGWQVVNYAKYREIRHAEDRREQNRVSQSAYRQRRKQNVSTSNQVSAESAQAEVDASKHLPPTPKTTRQRKSPVGLAPSCAPRPGAPPPAPSPEPEPTQNPGESDDAYLDKRRAWSHRESLREAAIPLTPFIRDKNGHKITHTPDGQNWRENPDDFRHSL